MPEFLSYISIPLFLLCSAFFSASEIAFASLSAFRLKAIQSEKSTLSGFLANKIHDDYNNILSTILIGNTLVNMAASSVATVIVIGLLGEKSAFLATVIMTLLVLVFGEVIPKVVAKKVPEKFAIIVSIPLYVVSIILKPITWLFVLFLKLVSRLWENKKTSSDTVSEDDFENIIDIAEDEGVLDEEQCDLLQNALEFDDVAAYEIITPRVDMVSIDIHDPYEVNVKTINSSNYSRIPVYEDTPDNIIGILHINHFFKESVENEKVNIRKLLLPVTHVHKTMPLPDVLEKMKKTKCHMVVVLDEYGGTMGILTLEDVLEQLVGEIFDENDDFDKEFVCIDDTHFEANGDMRIYDFFDEFDIDIEEDESFESDDITIGGFVTTMLEGETEKGSTVLYENLKITVAESNEKRVDKIFVEILPEENND